MTSTINRLNSEFFNLEKNQLLMGIYLINFTAKFVLLGLIRNISLDNQCCLSCRKALTQKQPMASVFDCNTTIHSSRSGMEIQYTKVQNLMSCLRELIDVDLLFELKLLFYVAFIKRGTQFTKHISQKTGCQIFS